MARVIQQIKQDLTTLEENVATFAVELHNIYLKYLILLSQVGQKQLILASYQLCTQAYPDAFLQLSFNQRQKLQETLRQLGQQIQPRLLAYLEPPKQPASDVPLNIMEQMLIQAPQPKTESDSSTLTPSTQEAAEPITNPEDLVQWCKRVEQGINETLEHLSQKANRYLQEAKVLPTELSTKILEMSLQNEESASPISSSPNLLNLLIETDDRDREEAQESKITKITTIHLRLSEIEFADPTLSVERNQLRHLLERLSKIRQQYRQKQREYAIAEAEAAWRASWYDD